jgi:hypothetical protein
MALCAQQRVGRQGLSTSTTPPLAPPQQLYPSAAGITRSPVTLNIQLPCEGDLDGWMGSLQTPPASALQEPT